MTNEEQIYICAVRYGLGRQTYITSVISDFMISKIKKLSVHCRDIMASDISGCRDYGSDCDKKSWMELLSKLGEQLTPPSTGDK